METVDEEPKTEAEPEVPAEEPKKDEQFFPYPKEVIIRRCFDLVQAR